MIQGLRQIQVENDMNWARDKHLTSLLMVCSVGLAMICAPAADIIGGRNVAFAADDDVVIDVDAGNVMTSKMPAKAFVEVDAALAGNEMFLGAVLRKNLHPVIIRDGNRVVPELSVFDHFVFGTDAGSERHQIEDSIKARIKELGITYGLTESQLTTLTLAAGLELQHFLRDVDNARQNFEPSRNGTDDIRMKTLVIRELNEKRKKLFETDSFFSKVAAKVITADQRANHQAAIQSELDIWHRSNIDSAIQEIDRQVDLRVSQQVALIGLLLRETQPTNGFRHFDDMVVKYRLSQISENRLKPLFDEDQWPRVSRVLDEFREFRTLLIRHGLIEKETTELKKPRGNNDIRIPAITTDADQPADANSPTNRGED